MLRRRFDPPPRARQLPLRVYPQPRNQRHHAKHYYHKPQPRRVVDYLYSGFRHAQENMAKYFSLMLQSSDSELCFRLFGMVTVFNYDFALRIIG